MRPLLMVHGISSNARKTYATPDWLFKKTSLQGMYNFLLRNGYKPGKTLFWYSYSSLKPVPVSAKRLKVEIDRVLQVSGCNQLDILTFSLGGIIAKYFAISPLYRNEIGKLVMIAPPFLGSHWADWINIPLNRDPRDLMFPGDSRALSPQILSYGNHFLKELAQAPFPKNIETTIIAVRTKINYNRNIFSKIMHRLTQWAGEGDLVVPVESTKIKVDHFYELNEEISLKAVHRFLPFHPHVQETVLKALL